MVLLLAGSGLAGCSRTADPDAPPRPRATPIAPATAPSATLRPVAPPPPEGFSGSGAFMMTWRDVKVVPTLCPAAHPLASCFAATASGTLPVVGDVTLARSMIVGDGPSAAPSGCVTAVSDGTLTNPTGTITFHADGDLCGRIASFTITSASGAGSLVGFELRGLIVNDSTTETWTGQVAPLG